MSGEIINREAGIRKAAILVASLDPETAEAMLSRLTPEQALHVREAAEELDAIAPEERQRIVDEFLRVSPMIPDRNPPGIELDAPQVGRRFSMPSPDTASSNTFGQEADNLESSTSRSLNVEASAGLDLTHRIDATNHGKFATPHYLRRSENSANLNTTRHALDGAGKDDDVEPGICDETAMELGGQPFQFLSEAEDEKLAHLLQSERPQTVALVLSRLPSMRAGGVLAHFPPNLQVEIIRRLVDLDEANPAVLQEIERVLESRLSQQFAMQRRRVAGIEAVASILNACDQHTSETMLEHLAACDQSLAEKLGLRTLTFDDLGMLDDETLASIFHMADPVLMQTALIGAEPTLVDRLLNRMPPREAKRLRKQLDHPGPLRLSDVDDARRQITAMVRRYLSRSNSSNGSDDPKPIKPAFVT
jgi:flagellar motor switch protein FliG